MVLQWSQVEWQEDEVERNLCIKADTVHMNQRRPVEGLQSGKTGSDSI